MRTSPSQYTLSELAAQFNLELHGSAQTLVDGVGTLRAASPTQLSFLANPGYRADLPGTRSGAVFLKAEDSAACPGNYFVCADPYLAYARAAKLFDTFQAVEPGIHSSAWVDPTACIGRNVAIGPQVVIGPRCEIGDGCAIGPGSVIEADSRLGAGCRLYANVSIGQRVTLGQRVIIHPGAVLGADGFGVAFAGDHWEKVPQLGGVVIGDDCEIGANTTIDRGAIDNTVLEEDVRVDNLVQIAHNVHIGAHTAIAALSGIAGSAKIGRYCLLAARCGVNGHIEIADHVTLAGDSMAFASIKEAGTTWSGLVPAQPIRQWHRNVLRLHKLDELAKRVRAVEQDQGKPHDAN